MGGSNLKNVLGAICLAGIDGVACSRRPSERELSLVLSSSQLPVAKTETRLANEPGDS